MFRNNILAVASIIRVALKDMWKLSYILPIIALSSNVYIQARQMFPAQLRERQHAAMEARRLSSLSPHTKTPHSPQNMAFFTGASRTLSSFFFRQSLPLNFAITEFHVDSPFNTKTLAGPQNITFSNPKASGTSPFVFISLFH